MWFVCQIIEFASFYVSAWWSSSWVLHEMQLILTHEHADAMLGLDNVRGVQPFNVNNDIPPMPVFVTQHTMDMYALLMHNYFVRMLSKFD